MAVQLTEEMISSAQKTELNTGVPASIVLGQIMLESGGKYSGGLSGLAYNYNNLFGVHARSGENFVELKENASGKSIKYKVYDTIADSVADHERIITLDRYKSKYANAQSVEDYAKALQQGGYATDPNYANKLVSTINANNLTQYDVKNYSAGVITSTTTTQTAQTNTASPNVELAWWGDVLKFTAILLIVIIGFFFLAKCLGIETSIKKGASKIAKKMISDKADEEEE